MVGKQFDLVWYDGDKRTVIGRASLNSSGHIEAQIALLHRPEIMEILAAEGVGEMQFSIVTPPLVMVKSTTTTTTTLTPPS